MGVCLIMVLWTGMAAAAEPCPQCPAGCVPAGLVGEFRTDVPAGVRQCPAGCVAFEMVKTMAEKPLGQVADVQANPPAPVTNQMAIAPKQAYADYTRGRIVMSNTALGLESGDLLITGYAAGLWQFDYALNENLQLGAFVVLPGMAAGVFPTLKAQVDLTDSIALGGGVFGGVFGPFTSGVGDWSIWMLGGHMEMTFSITRNNVINMGMTVAYWGYGLTDTYPSNGVLLIPNLGFRTTFDPRWSFQVELSMPFYAEKEGSQWAGDLFLLFYGFRGHGELIFGDIGFALPIFDEYIRYIWKYTPIGIPYFSIGFKI